MLDLLRRLQHDHALSSVFTSHDLAVVRAMADHVVVMKDGRVVESGPTDAIFASPGDPYTRALIGAALRAARRGRHGSRGCASQGTAA